MDDLSPDPAEPRFAWGGVAPGGSPDDPANQYAIPAGTRIWTRAEVTVLAEVGEALRKAGVIINGTDAKTIGRLVSEAQAEARKQWPAPPTDEDQ